MSLANVRTTAPKKASRILLYGDPGIGKTSLACQFPKPIVLMGKGETGLIDLVNSGQLPDTPYYADGGHEDIQSWESLVDAVESLTKEKHEFKTLVIDSIGCIEGMAVQHVTAEFLDGKEKEFDSYGTGWRYTGRLFTRLIEKLDALWTAKNMTIIIIGHTEIGAFSNPSGTDYSRYNLNVNKRVLSVVREWCKEMWFMHRPVEVVRDVNKKFKAGNAGTTYILTSGDGVFDAKSRSGLPPKIKLGVSARESYEILLNAMKEATKNGN